MEDIQVYISVHHKDVKALETIEDCFEHTSLSLIQTKNEYDKTIKNNPSSLIPIIVIVSKYYLKDPGKMYFLARQFDPEKSESHIFPVLFPSSEILNNRDDYYVAWKLKIKNKEKNRNILGNHEGEMSQQIKRDILNYSLIFDKLYSLFDFLDSKKIELDFVSLKNSKFENLIKEISIPIYKVKQESSIAGKNQEEKYALDIQIKENSQIDSQKNKVGKIATSEFETAYVLTSTEDEEVLSSLFQLINLKKDEVQCYFNENSFKEAYKKDRNEKVLFVDNRDVKFSISELAYHFKSGNFKEITYFGERVEKWEKYKQKFEKGSGNRLEIYNRIKFKK